MNGRILFITHQLSRTGAPIVLLDMIKLCKREGADIDVITMMDGELGEQLHNMGIDYKIMERFYPEKERLLSEWSRYNLVVANTIVTYEVIHVLNGSKIPVIWWLHEGRQYFEYFASVIPHFGTIGSNIHTYAVSPYVKSVIKDIYKCDVPMMHFAVDGYEGEADKHYERKRDVVKFLTAGTFSKIKGQDILAAAIRMLPDEYMKKAEFSFCGNEAAVDEEVYTSVCELEKDYNNLTGRTFGLKNQEIVVEMEDQNNSNKIVTDKTFIENYSLMYVGRYSDDKSEELRSIAIGGKRAAKSKMAKNHTYKIKKMYTENTLGQYTTGRWRESLIIFSNDYFQKVHKSLSCDEQELTELYLIKLKGKDKYKTWEKIKAFAQHRGMKIVNDGNERKIIYHTNSFVKEQKVRLMFELLSKIFILSILLASSALVISIKNKADLKFYQKRFEFLRCMGMKETERKKLQLIEIQSVNLVALIASLCMAVIHLIAYIMRAKKAGEINTVNFVKYWGCISMIYILFECVIQRVFAQHVLKEVEKQ